MSGPGGADAPSAGAGNPSRFPAVVYAVGEEPDPRFSLANERTFLAWVRTALALLAGGVGLQVFGTVGSDRLRHGAALLLVLLGAVAVVQSWVGWVRSERALRLSRALPGPTAGAAVAAGVLVAAVHVVLGVTR